MTTLVLCEPEDQSPRLTWCVTVFTETAAAKKYPGLFAGMSGGRVGQLVTRNPALKHALVLVVDDVVDRTPSPEARNMCGTCQGAGCTSCLQMEV